MTIISRSVCEINRRRVVLFVRLLYSILLKSTTQTQTQLSRLSVDLLHVLTRLTYSTDPPSYPIICFRWSVLNLTIFISPQTQIPIWCFII